MNVRQKITLLITGVGLLASLLYSALMLLDMVELPLRVIDADLSSVANRLIRTITEKADKSQREQSLSLIDDGRYWIAITNPNLSQEIYRSWLAQKVSLPEPGKNRAKTISQMIEPTIAALGQDSNNEVTFRIKNVTIQTDNTVYQVTIGRPVEQLEEEFWDTIVETGSSLFITFLVLLSGSYFVAGVMLKPIQRINSEIQEISEKQLDKRLPAAANRDEFGLLAETLNQLFDRLQYAFMRQEQLLADASHELRTPITMIRLELDEIFTGAFGQLENGQQKSLERAVSQLIRLEKIVKGLLDLSILEMGYEISFEEVDLYELLNSLTEEYHFLAEGKKLRLENRLIGPCHVTGDYDKLFRCFSNLLDNSIKYNSDGGVVTLENRKTEGGWEFILENTGPGIREEDLPNIFDQFFRGDSKSDKDKVQGAGLGLSIVQKIIQVHGGSIKMSSHPNNLTSVSITLPEATKKSASSPIV